MFGYLDSVFSLLFLIVGYWDIDLVLRYFEGLGFRESTFTNKTSRC